MAELGGPGRLYVTATYQLHVARNLKHSLRAGVWMARLSITDENHILFKKH